MVPDPSTKRDGRFWSLTHRLVSRHSFRILPFIAPCFCLALKGQNSKVGSSHGRFYMGLLILQIVFKDTSLLSCSRNSTFFTGGTTRRILIDPCWGCPFAHFLQSSIGISWVCRRDGSGRGAYDFPL